MSMNGEKRLNKSDRKRRTCLNDSTCQNVDDTNVASLARPLCQHQLLDSSVYDGHSLGRLNSDRLNAEVVSVPYCDLLTLRNRKADGCPSDLYLGRVIGNNDGYQRHQKLSNRKKKKKRNCGLEYVHTVSPSTSVPVNTADGAAGLVNWEMRSVGHSSVLQDHVDAQHSQPSTFLNEPFSGDDHLSSATITATVSATEKVFHLYLNQ